jgi:hypothetical protein
MEEEISTLRRRVKNRETDIEIELVINVRVELHKELKNAVSETHRSNLIT